MRSTLVAYACVAVALLCVPVFGIYPVFMMKLLCFAMFACAFNLLLGFSGMLSFGHAAFFGFSAYITAWLAVAHGWGTMPAVLASSPNRAPLRAMPLYRRRSQKTAW